MAEALPPQPAWSTLWTGPLEAGDTQFFVSRGYVHVIGSPRGVGKSEGGGSRAMGQLRPDRMDRGAALVRRQCRHGRHFRLRRRAISRRRSSSRRTCKAIFPFDPRGAYGDVRRLSARNIPAASCTCSAICVGHFSAMHQHKGARASAAGARRRSGGRRWTIPTTGCIRTSTMCIAQKGQHMPPYFDMLIDPYDSEAAVEESEAEFAEDQDPDLYRLRLVRLHLQDPSQRRAELFPQNHGAEEADVRRPRASRAAVPCVPRRDAALVRPLAQGHRHRHHGRAAGALLGDGRQ